MPLWAVGHPRKPVVTTPGAGAHFVEKKHIGACRAAERAM
jgi:hypothetical protein